MPEADGWHRCFAPDCRLRIAPGYAFCPEHWARLTLATQRLVMLYYRPGYIPEDESDWGPEFRGAVHCATHDLKQPEAPPAAPHLFASLDAPIRFSQERLKQCLVRELKWRRRVYPTRVQNHRMSQKDADEEIAMMTQILEHGFTPP